jgi:hypothetical protein
MVATLGLKSNSGMLKGVIESKRSARSDPRWKVGRCVFLHTYGVEKNTFLIAQPASFSISSLINSIT